MRHASFKFFNRISDMKVGHDLSGLLKLMQFEHLVNLVTQCD